MLCSHLVSIQALGAWSPPFCIAYRSPRLVKILERKRFLPFLQVPILHCIICLARISPTRCETSYSILSLRNPWERTRQEHFFGQAVTHHPQHFVPHIGLLLETFTTPAVKWSSPFSRKKDDISQIGGTGHLDSRCTERVIDLDEETNQLQAGMNGYRSKHDAREVQGADRSQK